MDVSSFPIIIVLCIDANEPRSVAAHGLSLPPMDRKIRFLLWVSIVVYCVKNLPADLRANPRLNLKEAASIDNASQQSERIAALEAENAKLRALVGPASVATTPTSAPSGGNAIGSDPSEVCDLLPAPFPSAASLWSSHLERIHEASRHESDPEYKHHDFVALLLHYMTGTRLERSIDTIPMDFGHVGRVLEVGYRRWSYFRGRPGADASKDPDAPRPLHVLVMGGSVAAGVVCHFNPSYQGGTGKRRACAWPRRLESFVNGVLGAPVIRVHDSSQGGTNSESGETLWRYGIFPPDRPHPDILINGYSTNDVHVNTIRKAQGRNQTLEASLWDNVQRFIRSVLTGCDPPLLIYFDDYLGNEQNSILDTMAGSQTQHLLSAYYGTMAVSYAGAVRDLTYSSTEEEWFSPHSWYEGTERTWSRQIHPGSGPHTAMAWTIAYGLLNLLTTYCGVTPPERRGRRGERLGTAGGGTSRAEVGGRNGTTAAWGHGYRATHGLPELRGVGRGGGEGGGGGGAPRVVPGGPLPLPDSLPPVLDADLTLDAVSAKWVDEAAAAAAAAKEEEEEQQEQRPDPSGGGRGGSSSSCASRNPCVLSFLAGSERGLDQPSQLDARLAPYLTMNEGWTSESDHGKLGLVPAAPEGGGSAPSGGGARFALEVKELEQPVRVITVMALQSYGPRWEGSRVAVRAEASSSSTSSPFSSSHGYRHLLPEAVVLSGEHGRSTSELYNHEIVLGGGGAPAGEDLRVEVELVGGTTFKIMGMALCSR